jgi:hypothetical protein
MLCCKGNIKRKSYLVPKKEVKGRQRLADIAHSNGAATCNSKAVNLFKMYDCIKSSSSYQM